MRLAGTGTAPGKYVSHVQGQHRTDGHQQKLAEIERHVLRGGLGDLSVRPKQSYLREKKLKKIQVLLFLVQFQHRRNVLSAKDGWKAHY